MKKPLYVLLFTLLIGSICNAQHFQWAKAISGADAEIVSDMATDPSGNLISVGWFRGNVDFNPGSGAVIFPNPGGQPDAYIQKLDANGNLLWAKQLTDPFDYEQIADAVKTDAAGNVYVAGRFRGTVDFDPGPGVFQLSSKSYNVSDVFILKLDAAGNFVWATQRQTASTFEYVAANVDLVLDNSNNIYSVYSFANSTVAFVYMIIEKANSSGTKIWDYKVERSGTNYADIKDRNITLDASSNVIVGGTFSGTLLFNPASSTSTMSLGGDNVYVLKIDNSGAYTWVRTAWGSITGNDVATNTTGDIYIAGNFSDKVDFDPGPAIQVDTASGNTLSMYVLKLNSAGNYIRVQHFAGTGNSTIRTLAVDAADNIYATGNFSQQLIFKTSPPIVKNAGAGPEDAFVMKLDSACNPQWAKQIGGANADEAYTITVDNGGNVYAGGTFYGTANFNWDGSASNLTAAGTSYTRDVFVCKFGACPAINTSVTQTGMSTLIASATGASYQWVNCAGNTLVAGATANTFTPTTSGNYAVIVTQNNCSDTSSCYSVIGTVISEIQHGRIVAMVPNPNNGMFTIQNVSSDRNAIVHITNIYGQQVSSLQTRTGNDIQVNLCTPAGIYFVTVSTAAGKQTEKVIVR